MHGHLEIISPAYIGELQRNGQRRAPHFFANILVTAWSPATRDRHHHQRMWTFPYPSVPMFLAGLKRQQTDTELCLAVISRGKWKKKKQLGKSYGRLWLSFLRIFETRTMVSNYQSHDLATNDHRGLILDNITSGSCQTFVATRAHWYIIWRSCSVVYAI